MRTCSAVPPVPYCYLSKNVASYLPGQGYYDVWMEMELHRLSNLLTNLLLPTAPSVCITQLHGTNTQRVTRRSCES